MNEDEEDPRAQGLNICRVTFIGATGIEWICIREVHDKAYFRRSGSRKGELIVGSGGSSRYAPQADRHEFVNRWPNRKKEVARGQPLPTPRARTEQA